MHGLCQIHNKQGKLSKLFTIISNDGLQKGGLGNSPTAVMLILIYYTHSLCPTHAVAKYKLLKCCVANKFYKCCGWCYQLSCFIWPPTAEAILWMIVTVHQLLTLRIFTLRGITAVYHYQLQVEDAWK